MGASPSNARQREFVSEIERWPEFKERTCLTSSDVSGIAAAFRKAIENGEGNNQIGRVDFEHWLEMDAKPSPVQERLFEVFVVSNSDEHISLYDFVLGLLNYCVDGKEYLSRLAFDVYDRHTTGTITEADLEGMLIDVWGPNWEAEELARGLLLERTGMDPMQPEEWEAFCRVYPNLLHPIYKLQRTLQDFTIGKKRWVKLGERLKKKKAKMEADHARMIRDALTEEDRLKAVQTIREEEAEATVLNGTKSQRMVAARIAGNGAESVAGLLPGIAVRAGSGGIHRGGPSMTTLAKSMEVRDRLEAVRKRSTALGATGGEADPTNWDENPLKRTNSKSIAEEEVPSFSMTTSRKIKAADLAEDGEDGGVYRGSSVVTAGSNGAKRSSLGSPSNSTQRQGPSLADTESFAGSTRLSMGGGPRIGGGQAYSGNTLGSPRTSEASDPRVGSRVIRPSSGELPKKRASPLARKQSSPTNLSTTVGGGARRKTSVAMAALTQRPDIAAKSGRKPSVAVGAGAAKRASAAVYRDQKRDLLSNSRVLSQQGVGGGRKPSRAVVAAGS